MINANTKPDQRSRASRVDGSTKGFTKRTLSDEEQERNRVHMSVAKEPHRWRRVLYRTSLPASALRVGLALADKYLNRKDGRCDPSHETLAEECDLSVRTVRDGLSALRELGLITTRKQGLQGTLFFYFSIPCNAAEIQQVDSMPQSGENPPSNVANFRRASGGDPASNLRRTSESEPSNTVVPSCPPSAVVAEEAPPVDLPATPTDLPRTTDVVSDVEPSDFRPEKEEAILSQDFAEQRRIVQEISGERGYGSDHVNQALLQMMRDGKLTASSGAALVAAWKQRGKEDAA